MTKDNKNIDFNIVFEKNQTLIFRTILGFVHSCEDAEDLTQEVFVLAYQNRHKFRGDSEISTWLYRIAINTSLNFIVHQKRKTILQMGEDIWNYLFNKSNDDKNPQQTLEEEEEKRRIQKAIDALPEKQKTAFILTRVNELPQKEVAEIMGISLRAVEQLLLRAKENLKKKLA